MNFIIVFRFTKREGGYGASILFETFARLYTNPFLEAAFLVSAIPKTGALNERVALIREGGLSSSFVSLTSLSVLSNQVSANV